MRSARTDDGTGESTAQTGLAVLFTGLMLFSVLAVPGVAGSVAASGASDHAATGATQATAPAAASVDAAGGDASVDVGATDWAAVDAAGVDAAIDAAATDTTAASDVALRVSIGKGAFEPGKSYQSNETVNIAVSAVDTSGTLPEAVSGVEMTISVEDPNGQVTNFTRTSTDGAVTVQYSLEGRPDGRYTVRATSSNESVTSGRTSFGAGPVIDFYPQFIDAKIEVGRETQITMGATSGGVPQSGVTRTVTVSQGSSFFGADFTKTVTTGPNGFATVNFTANSTGDYQISLESSNVFTSLTAVEAFADVETNGAAFGRVDGGETVYFTGRLVDDARPLANEPITVRIVNRSAFPTQQMTNISTTTDEFGQFVVSWQTPDNEGKSYKAQIYDSNGNRIKYDGGTVFTRRDGGGDFFGGGGDGTQGTTTSLETSLDVPMGPRGELSGPTKIVSPGQTVGATVIPRVNGTAQADKQVSYALTYGGGAVLETGTVTTNGSGVATLQFTIPESAPDDATLSLRTVTTLNGNTTNGYGSAAIQDYGITVTNNERLRFTGTGFFGSTSTFSGQSTGYTYNVTDVPSGDPLQGVRAMLVGEGRDRFHATSFDPQVVSTNASGLATGSIDIPETVAGTVWRETRYRYWTGVSSGRDVAAYNVTIEGPDRLLDPGGTATFSYTTDSETAASGILVVATSNESVDRPVVAARRLDPGQSTEVTFPNLAYNVSYTAQVTSINDRALTASSTTNVGVLGNGTDTDTIDTEGAVGRIGFDYVNQGGSVNLEVNGDREYNASSFSALDGSTVGGVSVSVTTTASNAGHVELDGPIDTFAVGGQETSVDNIEFGPQSNVTANVTFDTVSPTKSSYVVGDSLTADGVPAQIIDFTFTDGSIAQQGSGSLNTGSTQPPGGSSPSFFPSNVNLWFNVTDVVEKAGDQPSPATFTVEQFVAPSSATVGSGATLTATIENTGGEKATKTVDLRFDGQVVESRTLTLSPGETRVVATTVSADQRGSFTASVETPDDGASSTVDFVVENFACGAATGDPHMATIDGSGYDFQAAGEFVLARSSGGPGQDILVQARFVPISNSVSVTEAVATQIGGTEVMIDANHSTRLWIAGSPSPLAEGESTALEGGLVRRQGNTYTIVYNGSDGTADATDERVTVTVWGDRVDVEVCLREDRSEPVEGLLGDLDGDTSDDFALDNGTVLPNPPSFDTLYGSYRDSWRVNKSTTLFTYDEGESLSGFYDPNVPREAVSLDDLPDDEVDRAKQLAREAGLQPGTPPFRNAVLDYVLTNESDYFASARVTADTYNVTAPVGHVGFDYVDKGGSVNLQINGIRKFNVSSFSALNGSLVSATTVNVTTVGPNRGHVELTGPILSFAVGGQETEVDNIRFGPRSNVTANVTFNTVSPSKSSYVVGDTLTADGTPAQIVDFTFRDGSVYRNGSGSVDSATPRPPRGSTPSFATTNANIFFNATAVVERAGNDTGTGDDTGSAGPSRSTPDTIAPNGSATVTVTTNVSTSSVTFREVFSPAFDSASIESVTVNRDSQNPFLQVANSSGIVVTLQGLSAGDRVAVTYEVSVGSNAQTGTSYTIDGNVTSGTTAQLPTDTITVQETGCASLPDVARQYNGEGDCNIDIVELGQAAAAYAQGNLNIVKLGEVAAAYAQS